MDQVAGRRTPGQAALELAIVGLATALLIAGYPASRAANPDLLARVAIPARLAGLALLASGLLWRAGGGWSGIGLRRPRPLWRAAAVAVLGFLAGEFASILAVQLVFPILHLAPPPVPAFLARVRANPREYLYWMIPVTWGSAAFGEEMLFRGFILDRLDQLMGRRATWLAAILQGLLFGAAHGYLGPSAAILAGVLGVVLGVAFLAAGRNLWPCIVIHGLVDSLSITAVFLGAAR